MEKVRKYIFWLAIITLGFCALMACVDFICGEWIYGIVMVACMILNFFNAKSNANY